MKIQESRLERQNEIIENWKEVKGRGTLVACTGFGKTYVALTIMSRMGRAKPNVTFQVVVPTIFLKEQWEDRIEKLPIKPGRITIDVVNGLVQEYSGSPVRAADVLILDEIHKYGGPVFSKVFDAVDYDRVLGLTATMREDDKRDLILDAAPIFDVVTLEEALEEGWVSPFIIYNWGVPLSDKEQREYDAANRQFYKHFNTFNMDWNLAMKCLNDSNARRRRANFLRWEEKRVHRAAINFIRAVKKRKKILYTADSKIEAAKRLIRKFYKKTTICFSQRTEVADKLTEAIGKRAVSYHSNIDGRYLDDDYNEYQEKPEDVEASYYGKKAMKELAIERFKNPYSPVNVLNTARALDEGADIPAIDMGIVVGGTSKSLQAIQRKGRIIRLEEGKRAIFVNIYALGTQDEKWLNDRQSSTPSETIEWVRLLEEIEDV